MNDTNPKKHSYKIYILKPTSNLYPIFKGIKLVCLKSWDCSDEELDIIGSSIEYEQRFYQAILELSKTDKDSPVRNIKEVEELCNEGLLSIRRPKSHFEWLEDRYE